MKFIADLHIHSKFSRATSKECNFLNLYPWAKIKGIQVLGTGDFTHPGWMKEIEEYLVEDGEGLFDLKDKYKKESDKNISQFASHPMKFILSVEISCIYKKNNKVRKIHHVILMPDLKSAKKFNEKLGAMGNIRSDGRPILGLDSKDLFDLVLSINPDSIFIPAHIWTPWFSLFGMNSGFDTIEECFEDLTPEIFALETGLSSDPAMNWRLSRLDRFNLVSNSDAHSPGNLARESNIFSTELNYFKIREALKNKTSNEFLGTIEFFPEEGKYHFDGHRLCHVRLTPEETLKNKLRCPVCGKKVTVGVSHRVEVLADRKEGGKPDLVKAYHSVIPLQEIIADAFNVTKVSNKVSQMYDKMIHGIGSELYILREAPREEIKKHSTEIIAEGIHRVRNHKVKILPGYDGEYGKIIIFSEDDRTKNVAQSLFNSLATTKKQEEQGAFKKSSYNLKRELKENKIKNLVESNPRSSFHPNVEQLKAIHENKGPIIVIAGPGTGKTFTLIQKIIHLIQENLYKAGNILAITFTHKAAKEVIRRLEEKEIHNVFVHTFHGLALEILQENDFNKILFDTHDSLVLLREVLKELNIKKNINDLLQKIMKGKGNLAEMEDEEEKNIYEIYQARLDNYKGMDFEDIIIYCYKLLNKYPDILNKYKNKYRYILVDEFQDVNYAEYQLIKLLSDKGKNLFVIGDPDQSIYQFRGSSSELLFKLQEDFLSAKTIILRQNYRNPENIIKAAIDMIKPISRVMKKSNSMKPLITSKIRTELVQTSTELSACIQMAKMITHLVGGSSMAQSDMTDHEESYTFKDFAILVRNGSQIPLIEEVLIQEGIPYKLMGEKSILEEPVIRLMLDIMRLAVGTHNAFRLFQVLKSKYFEIPDTISTQLKGKLLENPEIDLIHEIEDLDIGNKNLTQLKKILNKSTEMNIKPEKFIYNYDFTFYQEEKWKDFLPVVNRFDTMRELFNHLFLGEEQDFEIEKDNIKKIKNIEKLSILTIHSAKGLEFPIVFIYEPVEGIMPYLEKDADLNEETRLFYVAMTRAREKLFFIVPRKRKQYGHIMETQISRFIRQIHPDLLSVKELKISIKPEQDKSQMKLW